jgi:oligopeptide/dipeptide ABC transporter ATP-binding protein
LIIADEPTTALDSTIQKQVVDLFKSVNVAYSTAVLMISHDLGLVKYYCQRSLVLYAGQIMEEADVEALFAHPKHPYTKALIRVIPSLNIVKGARLEEIPGHIPDLKNPLQGCVFKERCSFRQDICNDTVQTNAQDLTHTYRCNFDL